MKSAAPIRKRKNPRPAGFIMPYSPMVVRKKQLPPIARASKYGPHKPEPIGELGAKIIVMIWVVIVVGVLSLAITA